jgi:hypothetical protein
MIKCESTAVVECEKPPGSRICVTKEVACYLPGEQCGPYGKIARGAKCDPTEPLFCYRITVANCGVGALNNVVLTDSELGDITADILGAGKTSLAEGESVTGTLVLSAGQDTTNTVVATGVGAAGASVTNSSSAVALVKLANIICVEFALSEDDLDGFDDDHVLLPNDGKDHYVTFTAYVENDCEIDLVNVTITDPVLASYGCTNFPAPFSLKAGESASFELCVCLANCATLPLTNRRLPTT